MAAKNIRELLGAIKTLYGFLDWKTIKYRPAAMKALATIERYMRS